MDPLDHVIIRCGRGRRLHIDNQMGCVGPAGLRDMDLIAHPLDRAFGAVAGLRVIGGSDEFGRGGHVFDLAPAQAPVDLEIRLSPDLLQRFDGGHLLQPGLIGGRSNRAEQRLAIRPDDCSQCLAGLFALLGS